MTPDFVTLEPIVLLIRLPGKIVLFPKALSRISEQPYLVSLDLELLLNLS